MAIKDSFYLVPGGQFKTVGEKWMFYRDVDWTATVWPSHHEASEIEIHLLQRIRDAEKRLSLITTIATQMSQAG